jgi:hypothetical protein
MNSHCHSVARWKTATGQNAQLLLDVRVLLLVAFERFLELLCRARVTNQRRLLKSAAPSETAAVTAASSECRPDRGSAALARPASKATKLASTPTSNAAGTFMSFSMFCLLRATLAMAALCCVSAERRFSTSVWAVRTKSRESFHVSAGSETRTQRRKQTANLCAAWRRSRESEQKCGAALSACDRTKDKRHAYLIRKVNVLHANLCQGSLLLLAS